MEVRLANIPTVVVDENDERQLLKIVSAIIFNKYGQAGVQWLREWTNHTEEQATWEDSDHVQKKCPIFKSWGQGLDKTGGCNNGDNSHRISSWGRKKTRTNHSN
ncbi:hypothetical protein Adt_41972 [Abeliophyllum distichum]|uniref:Chromo domain-containing protein n=1 Tax=Abeliophyllum distichum TaxID=126358 RepID=A0ABD1PUB3_9LAMI